MEQFSAVNMIAFDYHKSGFHCAEAVLKAIAEIYGEGISDDVLKVATAFGGGVGRTKQDICGALAGGILALGCLYGRSEPGTDWTEAADLAAKLRKKFVKTYGTTNCGALLNGFGPQQDMIRCKQLSGEVADILARIIRETKDCENADSPSNFY
jgi:C_GCAxxG_C_C family probable redox protein